MNPQTQAEIIKSFIVEQIVAIKNEVMNKSYGEDPEKVKVRKLELKTCLRKFATLLFCAKIVDLIHFKTKSLEGLGSL